LKKRVAELERSQGSALRGCVFREPQDQNRTLDVVENHSDSESMKLLRGLWTSTYRYESALLYWQGTETESFGMFWNPFSFIVVDILGSSTPVFDLDRIRGL
jgi:hypothetical protein